MTFNIRGQFKYPCKSLAKTEAITSGHVYNFIHTVSLCCAYITRPMQTTRRLEEQLWEERGDEGFHLSVRAPDVQAAGERVNP